MLALGSAKVLKVRGLTNPLSKTLIHQMYRAPTIECIQ